MSSINSFGNTSYLQGQDPLSIALKNSGISTDTLKTVSSDINSVFQAQSGSGSSPPDRTSIRSAINAKLSSDVSSGTLSSADATKITSALDKLDQQFQSGGSQGQRAGQAGGPPPGGPPPGGPPPGGQSKDKSSGSNSSASSSESVAKQLIDLINSNSDSSSDSSSSTSSTSSSSSNNNLESYLKKLLSQNFVDTSA
jgi:hypothetical protein